MVGGESTVDAVAEQRPEPDRGSRAIDDRQGGPRVTTPPAGPPAVVGHAAEKEYARALARYEWVLAHVADGIYGLDAEGRVEFVNPSAIRVTGYPEAAQLGLDQHALLHDRHRDGSPYDREDCPVWRALRTGETVVADDELFWHSDGHAVPIELIAVPTIDDGVVTGTIVSFRDLTERREAERQAAELARIRRTAEAHRALADQLQQALLTPPPDPGHVQVAVRYLPASNEAQVGGDWYDAFVQPDGSITLVIGDIVGHGSTAAAAMGQLRGLVRALAYDNQESPAATLVRSEHAARGLAVTNLATAILARVEQRFDDPTGDRMLLRWSNAGHVPPILLAPDGTTTLMETEPDRMLGVDPDSPRHEHTAAFEDGHTLLLVTDGMIERRGADLDVGMAALREAMRDLGGRPVDELCDVLLSRMVPDAPEDDVALVAVRSGATDRSAGARTAAQLPASRRAGAPTPTLPTAAGRDRHAAVPVPGSGGGHRIGLDDS